MTAFDDRWLRLARAARQVPADPLPTLDVDRLLAARARPPARPRVLRIGWFPPGLAAAAMLAASVALASGLDPRPATLQAVDYLAELPSQVPHAPEWAPPVAVPSPTPYLTLLKKELMP